MGTEIRIQGPPGTGKTRRLAWHVEAAAAKYGRGAILVSSFTKAAARVISSRVDLPDEQVATLHAHAFRALGRPEIAEGLVREWNESPMSSPRHKLSRRSAAGKMDDPLAGDDEKATEGDALLQALNLWRARMVPRELWPGPVLHFEAEWRAWKQDRGALDFTDLIEHALWSVETAPGEPLVGMFDEVQDWSPLELALVRKWGAAMGAGFLLAGDPDQTLYSFKGASARSFHEPPLPADRYETLSQSWRVPALVHAEALAWIRRANDRVDCPYLPRAEPGVLERGHDGAGQGWTSPGALVERAVEDRKQTGRSQMFLASCAFQLAPLCAELRRRGIPFWNPYRTANGAWNPLRGGSERLTAFLRAPRPDLFGGTDPNAVRLWTWGELWRFAEPLAAADVFLRGPGRGKALIEAYAAAPDTRDQRADPASLRSVVFEPAAWNSMLEAINGPRPWAWLRAAALASWTDRLAYAFAIADTLGPAALVEEPGVIVGTVHCSPPDEPILTTSGYVRIGDLEPRRHRLAGYNENVNRLSWGGRQGKGRTKTTHGFPFSVSQRNHHGVIVHIETAKSSTRVTPDHVVLARLAPAFFDRRWVVYLMRRGNWWRIGMCRSGHRPYRSGGIAGRLATEKADCAWILSVHDSRAGALRAEAVAIAVSGVPGITFQPARGRSLDAKTLHEIHSETSDVVEPRAREYIRSVGLVESQPLYTRATGTGFGKRNMRGVFETAAANLCVLDGLVEMLVASERFELIVAGGGKARLEPLYLTARVSSHPYSGPVFGLDVVPLHRYVSGGAVVHNSVKGGEADRVVLFPDLSPAGWQEWTGKEDGQDSIRRMFYVGMTRARSELFLAGASSGQSVAWTG